MLTLSQVDAQKLLSRRHPEYIEFENLWRRIQDSLEGGNQYRFSTYGTDTRDSSKPIQNLIRHKKEYPPPAKPYDGTSETNYAMVGQDPYAQAAEDSYKLRLARTPVPLLLPDGINYHLSRIYCEPIHREGPDDLVAFWENVDQRGATIDEWLSDTVAELYLALGFIDLLFDHPSKPEGEEIKTAADVDRLNLKACVATVILPQNLLWWRLDARGRYVEVLVQECRETETGIEEVYRHWDASGSQLYTDKGAPIGEPVPHPFRRVPIARFFDRRRTRCRNVGQSRYEGVLELEREFYNEDSELILTNTLQAHPTMQGPFEAFGATGLIEVGPSGLLPIKSNANGTPVEWSFVSPPKDGAEFLQKTKVALLDRIDRQLCRTKPAGSSSTSGTGASTVSQSGYSKELDQRDGNDLLTKRARSLRRLEMGIAEFALMVLRDKPVDIEAENVEITYPGGFNLLSAQELAVLGTEIQTYLTGAGELPQFEIAMLQAMVREALPGLDPKQMEAIHAEIEDAVNRMSKRREEEAEAGAAGMLALAEGEIPAPPDEPPPNEDETAPNVSEAA